MFVILKIPWILFTAAAPEPHPCYVPAGSYELERVANPFGRIDQPWLVIRGTCIGASEMFFMSMDKNIYGNFMLERRPP